MTTNVATNTTSAQTTVNTRIGELKYENEYPSGETVNKLYDEIDFQRACQAYLRKILVHGARAAVLRIKRDQAPIGAWMDALERRAHRNVLIVAFANKLARIAWAVLSSGEDYRPHASAVLPG